ncbi:hypothetical protein GAY33_02895 [Azospirillum brasilense]|uniref:hypothetical protein n=1 Tax=Azospirillum argentinense TaxID=2970906 RepID=UPI00190DBB44|nr:hypothetical protein [Azospirillum argentinense]MBK3798198.1 hypothetical protein [Azospirillum argentinense]
MVVVALPFFGACVPFASWQEHHRHRWERLGVPHFVLGIPHNQRNTTSVSGITAQLILAVATIVAGMPYEKSVSSGSIFRTMTLKKQKKGRAKAGAASE